jgi:SAM-dependent methyltransferase
MSDRGWTTNGIAQRQRELVDDQLIAMKRGFPPQHFAVVGHILNWLRENRGEQKATLLDAACASGYYSEVIEHFVPEMVEYTGADFSDDMLELAREKYPDLSFVQADLRNMPQVSDRLFDVVMSGAALMHIAEWDQALAELARVADMWLILHRTWVFADDSPTRWEARDAYGAEVRYYTFNEGELLGKCEDLGFSRILETDSGESIGAGGAVKTFLLERNG